MPPRPIPVTTSIAKSDVQSSHMDRDLEKNTQQLKITTVVSSREHIMPFGDVICLTQRKKIYDEFDSHLQTNTIQVGRVRYVFNATARCGEQVVLDDLSSSQRAVFPRSRNKLLTILDPFLVLGHKKELKGPKSKEEKYQYLLRNGKSLIALPYANEFALVPSWRKWNKQPFSRRFKNFAGCYFLVKIRMRFRFREVLHMFLVCRRVSQQA